MREIKAEEITKAVKEICIESNFVLPDDVWRKLKEAQEKEESPIGKEVIKQIIENNRIAKEEKIPICQDTGVAVVFVELGQEVHVVGGNLSDAINNGVRQGYIEGYLRKSIVADPLRRKNTDDNTPAVIHTEVVLGDKLKITVLPKGGGSENMSAVAMLPPSSGVEDVKKFVIDTVKKAGSNPCPPIVVGVGIGGTFDSVTLLAKKALLRSLESHHPEKLYADLEHELLQEVNNTGIGPQGLGGRFTTLAVLIETYPCHIAAIPVAVNIQCHACRRAECII
ncbi:MAG: fumarate hydratase [Elusimicrobiota bacterium]|nr:fumarate hydratase [Elusimicrobiota bacterium]